MDTLMVISKEKEKQNNFLEDNKIKEQLKDTRNKVKLLEINACRLNINIRNTKIGIGLVSICTIGLIVNNIYSKFNSHTDRN